MQFTVPFLALLAGVSAANRYYFGSYDDTNCQKLIANSGRAVNVGDCWQPEVNPSGSVEIYYSINAKAVGWSNADCTGEALVTLETSDTVGESCVALNGKKPLSFSNFA